MDTENVTVRRVRVLRGPNLYAYMPVLHIVLDIGPYEGRPSSAFLGFIERLRQGTYLGHIAEHVTLELQGILGFDVRFGRARGTGERGVYDVIIAYKEEEPARTATSAARSSRCSIPTGRRRASRSLPSPAPTARRR